LPRPAAFRTEALERGRPKPYAGPGDLAAALRRFRGREPIRARRVGVVGRLWRWSRRRPLLAGLAAALLVSLAGGLAGMTALWLQAEAARQGAVGVAEELGGRRAAAPRQTYP